MRKSTLFISTALTIFMMATIFGVASAYQQIVKNQTVVAQQAAVSQMVATQPAPVVQEVVAQPAVVQSTVITPEQATTIASTFLNDTAVYKVETVNYQGAVAYLVTFSSGNLVYVSTTGDILAVSKIPPVVIAGKRNGNSGGASTSNVSVSSGGGEHDSNQGGDD